MATAAAVTTAPAPRLSADIEDKVRRLREIYADGSEFSKTALENVIRAVQSGEAATESQPMKSAGRIGARRGKVSELTTLFPINPSSARRMRAFLELLHPSLGNQGIGNFTGLGDERDPIVGLQEEVAKFTIPKDPVRHRVPDIRTFNTLRGGEYFFHAELVRAEMVGLYGESLHLYHGVSPFPLALLDFQRGLMWMSNHRLDDARKSFDTALRRVPAYAPALGHLAEVEAELGETEIAIARLSPLAIASDCPDYAGHLAHSSGKLDAPISLGIGAGSRPSAMTS